ncbi:hypothetical protein [Kineococcus arenarius]|uniref:hypothetical protein n=1 Tax=Kineococcus sp. SYSU DK007 TaxID=3383128 RepID=UPI003D7E4E06
MRRLPAALTCLVLGLGAASCSASTESGASADCTLDGCTVTFPRDGRPEVSVLGVEARLLEAGDGSARLEVAGQEVALEVGTEAQVAGFTAGLDRVTDSEVVVVLQR